MPASLTPSILAALLRDAEEADAESVAKLKDNPIDTYGSEYDAGFAAGIRHALRVMQEG